MANFDFWRLKQLLIFLLIALAANFNYGFSSTYLNTSVDQFKIFLNISYAKRDQIMTESQYGLIWNLFLNCWPIGSFVGACISPIFNDRFGRKIAFLVGNFFAFIASILQCMAILWYCPELLIASRFITSICMAISYQSCILFLQECSPTHLRGSFSFLSEVSYSTMTMIGSFLGQEYILGSHLFWLCFFPVPFCLLFTITLVLLPETPKFLLISKDQEERATRSVELYHGVDSDAKGVLEDIRKEAECESTESESSTTFQKLKEIFTEPHLRKALLLSIAALANTIGLWTMLLSSTTFLEDANIDSKVAEWSSTTMSLAYVFGTITGGFVIERFGRRKLLLIFTFLNNLALLAFIFFAKIHNVIDPLKYGCIVALIAYGYTYGTGVGPISWFISSELVPLKHRSIAQSVAGATDTIMVTVTTLAVLPLYDVIGSYAFLILYSVPSSISMIFLLRYLPETKGREIHDIVNELKNK